MEAEVRGAGLGQTMRDLERQIRRSSFIQRAKRDMDEGVWSECFRRALWLQKEARVGSGRPVRKLLSGST